MQFVGQVGPPISFLNTEKEIKLEMDWIVVLSTDLNRYISSTELVEYIKKELKDSENLSKKYKYYVCIIINPIEVRRWKTCTSI
ncbi:MAG: hypothetical protein ACMUEM_03415 [Flavobacteriales bacterium AspAUS03]